jgi:site-specific recombinase XerC
VLDILLENEPLLMEQGVLSEVEVAVNTARTKAGKRQALRDRAIIVLLLNTGLRISELCALELGDVILTDRKGEVRVRSGKGEKARTVPLNKPARGALRTWLDVRGEANSDNLFTSKRSDALTPKCCGAPTHRTGPAG